MHIYSRMFNNNMYDVFIKNELTYNTYSQSMFLQVTWMTCPHTSTYMYLHTCKYLHPCAYTQTYISTTSHTYAHILAFLPTYTHSQTHTPSGSVEESH